MNFGIFTVAGIFPCSFYTSSFRCASKPQHFVSVFKHFASMKMGSRMRNRSQCNHHRHQYFAIQGIFIVNASTNNGPNGATKKTTNVEKGNEFINMHRTQQELNQQRMNARESKSQRFMKWKCWPPLNFMHMKMFSYLLKATNEPKKET